MTLMKKTTAITLAAGLFIGVSSPANAVTLNELPKNEEGIFNFLNQKINKDVETLKEFQEKVESYKNVLLQNFQYDVENIESTSIEDFKQKLELYKIAVIGEYKKQTLSLKPSTLEEFKQLHIEDQIDEKINEQIIKKEVEIEQVKQEQQRLQQIESQRQQLNSFINMINVTNVETLDLRTPSYLTPTQANDILNGTGLDGLGEAFVNAEKNYGVNAYYLMAHAAVESNWGKSNISKSKNNLFGFTAYDASPGSSATRFNSKAHCIDFVAKYISVNYLSENGKHYNGSTLRGMNVKYASDKKWATTIAQVFDKLVDKTPTPI